MTFLDQFDQTSPSTVVGGRPARKDTVPVQRSLLTKNLIKTSPKDCSECQRSQHLCHEHANDLKRMLTAEVPAALKSLQETFARQTAIGDRVGPRSSESPLPYDWRASESADLLLAKTINRWAQDVWRCNPDTAKPSRPMVYLVQYLPQLAKRSWSIAMYLDIDRALTRAWKTVDLPEEYLEAGVCDRCQQRLQARPNQDVVECKCGQTYDVVERRAAMLASIEDRWFTAAELERWILLFLRMGETERIKRRRSKDEDGSIANTIRKWGERSQIPTQRVNERTKMYRTRDVLDRFLQSQPKGARETEAA